METLEQKTLQSTHTHSLKHTTASKRLRNECTDGLKLNLLFPQQLDSTRFSFLPLFAVSANSVALSLSLSRASISRPQDPIFSRLQVYCCGQNFNLGLVAACSSCCGGIQNPIWQSDPCPKRVVPRKYTNSLDKQKFIQNTQLDVAQRNCCIVQENSKALCQEQSLPQKVLFSGIYNISPFV